jgi:hypothetical protein
MFVGTIDELIAVLEVERDRIGGQAAVRYTAPWQWSPSLPFVKGGYLKKDGLISSRKTAIPCVLITIGDDLS